MIDDVVLLYGETKLPADDCKVIFKDKHGKEHEVEISREDNEKYLKELKDKL